MYVSREVVSSRRRTAGSGRDPDLPARRALPPLAVACSPLDGPGRSLGEPCRPLDELCGGDAEKGAQVTPSDHSDDWRPGLTVRAGILIPEAELQWRFSRSSGPGGQSVNTTDSRVELSFDVAGTTALGAALKDRALERLESRLVDGVLTVAASEHRSQWRNREAARARLVALLRDAIAAPPRKRRPTRPSKGAVRRRLEDKKRRGETKRLRGRPAD